MSQDDSAALQGVAERPIGSSSVDVAHDSDILQNRGANLEPKANQASPDASINLESSQVQLARRPELDSDAPSPLNQHSPYHKHTAKNQAEPCVTTTPPESKVSRDTVDEGQAHDSVSPPNTILPVQKQKPPPALLSIDTGPRTTSYIPPSHQQPRPPHLLSSNNRKSNEGASGVVGGPSRAGNMFFNTNASLRRRTMANTSALTEYEADLTSRDRARQKEAVRRFLDENIDDEWKWQWPRPANAEEPTFVDQLARTGRSAERWKERDEWLSNTNDSDDDPSMPTAASPDTVSPISSSFLFESPDDVGDSIKRRELERKRRRERKLREELTYNDGLRCFVERRNAWTGARQVPRRMTRTSSNTLSSIANLEALSLEGGAPEVNGHEEDDLEEETEIPVAPPLLPPNNAMRSSITPAAYNTIYDKVVLQHLAPSCPMNLQDLVSSCVQGWKRDGEWPPKNTAPEPAPAARKKSRKLSVASIFGLSKHDKEFKEKEARDREKEAERESGQSGIRRSFQKFLSLGHKDNGGNKDHAHTNGNGNLDKGKEAELATAAA